MGDDKPLIMERPQRGREMVSKQVPGGLVGEGQSTALMHEGYVGDTKYVVPDSNLQVMKELVDYQLGKPQHKVQSKPSRVDLMNRRYSEHCERMKSKLGDDNLLTPESSVYSADSDTRRGRRKDSDSTSSSSSSLDTGEEETSKSGTASSKDKPKGNDKRKDIDGAQRTPRGSKSTKDSTGTSKSNRDSTRTSNLSKDPSDRSKPPRLYIVAKSEEKGPHDQSGQPTGPSSTKYKQPKQGRDSRASTGTSNKSRKSSDPSKQSRGSSAGKSQSSHNEDPWSPKYGAYRGGTEPFIDSLVHTEKVRFLISGHIKNDPLAKPIFIFHQYDGDSPFGEEKPDFSTNKPGDDINIGVTGKFYKESILEEENDYPKSLKIKPIKIPIDSQCKVCEEEFSQTIQLGDYDFEINGQFIKQSVSSKLTPFFTFKVQNTLSSGRSAIPKNENVISNRSPTQVYTANPVDTNLFSKTPTEDKLFSVNSIESSQAAGPVQNVVREKEDSDYESMRVEAANEPNLISKKNSKISKPKANKHHPEDAGDFKKSSSVVVYRCTIPRRKHIDKKDGLFKRISKMFFPDSEADHN